MLDGLFCVFFLHWSLDKSKKEQNMNYIFHLSHREYRIQISYVNNIKCNID